MGKFLFPIHRVLSMTIMMPLFIQVFRAAGVTMHINVLLLFALTALMMVTALVNHKNIGINRLGICFFIFLVLSILQIITFSKILPILFFLQCFLLTLFLHYEKIDLMLVENKKIIFFTTVLYIGISVLLLLLNLNFDVDLGRFYGLGYSPTTFVIYLVVYLVLFHYLFGSSKTFYLLFVLSLVLTYFSGTRTGLLLLLLLPLNNYFYDRYLHSKKMVRLLMIVFIIGVYPLSDIISVTNPELLEVRFTDGEEKIDYSYATRMAFTADVVNEWLIGGWEKKLLGFGTEFSRLTILKFYDEDHQLHNDFLRLNVDFGFPVLLMFVGIIYSLSSNNKYSFFLALIYMFSFYHNLIYEAFLFNTFLFMSKAKAVQN